jgi:hypothetical protein
MGLGFSYQPNCDHDDYKMGLGFHINQIVIMMIIKWVIYRDTSKK